MNEYQLKQFVENDLRTYTCIYIPAMLLSYDNVRDLIRLRRKKVQVVKSRVFKINYHSRVYFKRNYILFS